MSNGYTTTWQEGISGWGRVGGRWGEYKTGCVNDGLGVSQVQEEGEPEAASKSYPSYPLYGLLRFANVPMISVVKIWV